MILHSEHFKGVKALKTRHHPSRREMVPCGEGGVEKVCWDYGEEEREMKESRDSQDLLFGLMMVGR